ncbi:hypothetical protein ABXN37_15500 [Piscinibacter sakaiensis]|uniref:hypothetical protein n=1 Tax=Piscinibacter sakaiensis TaxID=1547922 RepID=UPI00372BBF70
MRASRAGTQQLQREPVALAALVDEALLEHRPGALARGVALEVEVDDAVVHVDRFLLARALGTFVQVVARRHGGSLQVRSPGPGGTRLDIDCAAAAS